MDRLAGLVRCIGLIYGFAGVGAALSGLLAVATSLGGRWVPPDGHLWLLMFGLVEALGALLGFIVMFGFFRLKRWARFVLMASALFGLGLGLTGACRPVDGSAESLHMLAVALILGLAGLAFAISVSPAVRRVMNQ